MADPHDAPDGAIDAALTKVFGRSWRTSLTGAAALIAGAIALLPGISPTVVEVARMVALAATGSGLMLAKDRGVSGAPR